MLRASETGRWQRRRQVVIALILTLVAGPAGLAVAGDGNIVVNCAVGSTVQKTRPVDCRGRIVDDAEAARILEKRRAYIRGAVEEPERVAPRQRLKGVGTGFFIGRDGTLLTNLHVVRECSILSVSPAATAREAEASVIAVHRGGIDLALLRAETSVAAVARFAPTPWPKPGTAVGIVGYPDQGIPPIRPLMVSGEIEGPLSVGRNVRFLKMKAAVRPGNSGGPVLDPQGNVVGVVFAKINTVGLYERTGQVVRDVGFAIPLDLTERFLRSKGVSLLRGPGTSASPVKDLLDHARGFVARVNCYR